MSISKFFMVGTVKAIGATARGACSVAYAAGNDITVGFNAACVEAERQGELTKAHHALLQARREQRLAAAAARAAAAGCSIPGVAAPAAPAPMSAA